ncbi:MAG TPA: rhamnogalacturonan acetylesterase [Chthoniobacteraceae bacterium]|jgi:lysophospholipase L1-like esterase
MKTSPRFFPIRFLLIVAAAAFFLSLSARAQEALAGSPRKLPAVFLVGDSTVKNSTRGLQGWGTPIASWFDQTKIKVENRALGGRSSRSYIREELWDKVVADLQPGDFVLIQFGHNDGGPLDEGRARASLKGDGEETKDVVIKETGVAETVRTYGAYLRRYVADTKAKGATPIVCSLVPRNIWADGRVVRASDSYGKWAEAVAKAKGVFFLDLNEIIARKYEAVGPEKVLAEYFTAADHTHTTPAGAAFNAACVAEGIRALPKCPLSAFVLREPTRLPATVPDAALTRPGPK